MFPQQKNADERHNTSNTFSSNYSKNSEEEKQKVLNNEIKILQTLNHPNIIKYHESFVYKKSICIITEFAENGDLQKKIKDVKKGKKYAYSQK